MLMKKFTLFFMSMFLILGTAMAKDEEVKEFGLQYTTPQNGAMITEVERIILGFTKDVTVTFPEEGIDVVNTTTQEVVKITGIDTNEYAPKNQVTFLFEQETVPGKDGKDEQRSKIINAPGSYSYTIPAGVIKSVDNDEFPETTFTFTIVKTFPVVDWSPKEAAEVSEIVVTFDKEITDTYLSERGLEVIDNWYYSPVTKVNDIVIGDDKKSVTLKFETLVNTEGGYILNLSQGTIISGDEINEGKSLTFNIVDLTPRFETNYKDGDKVKVGEFGNFEISFKNVEVVELKQTEFTVLNLTAQSSITGTAAYSEETKKITVTLGQELTQAGDYQFKIPAGMFTMDGVENEARNVNINLYKFTITPLEVVSVTPEAGKVSVLDKIVVKFNQTVSLSWTDDWMSQPSQQITLTCGEQKFTLTNASGSALSDQVEYLVNAEWDGFEWKTTPITAAGTYTLNLADIIVDYAAEMVTDQYGTYVGTWHGKNASCEGTCTWTIEAEDNAIEFNHAEAGEQVIYDLLGRRVEKATTGIYIVNGRKVIIK